MLSRSVKWCLKTEKSWLRSSLRNSRNDGNTTPCRRRGREGRGGPDFSGELGKVKWDRLSRRRSRMAPEGEGGGKGGKGGERRHPLCSALSILLQTAEWEEEKSTNREILIPKTSWDFSLSIWIASIFPEPASYLPIWIPRQRLINAQHKLRLAHYP